MDIVYHLGAHCTDEDRILKCLLNNRAVLARQGIVVTGPGRYRNLLREAMLNIRSGRPGSGMQEEILEAVLEKDSAGRVVFFNDSFLAMSSKVLAGDRLYPTAGEKASWMRAIFPDKPVTFAIALRNPATFLPALFAITGGTDFAAFLGGADPARLCWSETIARLSSAVPDCPVTVWCNEDTPLLWPQVLRAVAGHDAETRLEGEDDFLSALMRPEGMARMQAYFADHPPASEDRRRRAVSAFLEKFGRPEELEIEIDLPGWSAELIEAMTAAYEADLRNIEALPGVTLLR